MFRLWDERKRVATINSPAGPWQVIKYGCRWRERRRNGAGPGPRALDTAETGSAEENWREREGGAHARVRVDRPPSECAPRRACRPPVCLHSWSAQHVDCAIRVPPYSVTRYYSYSINNKKKQIEVGLHSVRVVCLCCEGWCVFSNGLPRRISPV